MLIKLLADLCVLVHQLSSLHGLFGSAIQPTTWVVTATNLITFEVATMLTEVDFVDVLGDHLSSVHQLLCGARRTELSFTAAPTSRHSRIWSRRFAMHSHWPSRDRHPWFDALSVAVLMRCRKTGADGSTHTHQPLIIVGVNDYWSL